MTMSYDTGFLQLCRDRIEKKLGWPPPGEWRDFEFTELSDKIFDATGIQLSTTTLKRVFGKVKYESLPSSATLNALVQFLGYENWMQFKAEQPVNEKKAGEIITAVEKRKIVFNRKPVAGIAALLTIAVIFGFVFFSSKSSSSTIETKDVLFKSRPLAEGLPNSVVFNVDLKNIKSNDIIIQQSWDSTRTVRLKTGQTEATAIYYVPGYFRAKLIVDKKIIKEHDLFIRSTGSDWMATIDNNPDPPTYLKENELILDNGMNVSTPVLDKIKKIERPTALTYHLARPFEGLHSDNFTLETNFQNTYSEGPAVCKTTKLFILCSNGAFIIPFTIPGCVSDVNLKLADKTWEGRSNDLSVFGIDPSQKINLKLEVKNRSVKIFCNGKLLREASYNINAGDIVGLRYSFLGAGKVYDISMKNEKGEISYSKDFN